MKPAAPALATWAAAGLLFASPVLAAGDPVQGKAVFSRCASCHSIDPGRTMIGPSLARVMGRKAGSLDGFVYSPAMRHYGQAWDEASLDSFLASPSKAVPGTRMTFAGLPDPKDRANLIAYLKSISVK